MPMLNTTRRDGSPVVVYIPHGSTREDIDRILDGDERPADEVTPSDRCIVCGSTGECRLPLCSRPARPVAPPDPHPLAVLLRQVADVLEDHGAPPTVTCGYLSVTYGPHVNLSREACAWLASLPGAKVGPWFGWTEAQPWYLRIVEATVAGLDLSADERDTDQPWAKWTTTGPGPLLVGQDPIRPEVLCDHDDVERLPVPEFLAYWGAR